MPSCLYNSCPPVFFADVSHNVSLPQATDHIVDLALAAGKPFAIVPCCVFPRQNSHRRTKDGGPVRSYEQFIEYLLAKDPGIRREVLPGLPGRNVVLFKLPQGLPLPRGGGAPITGVVQTTTQSGNDLRCGGTTATI